MQENTGSDVRFSARKLGELIDGAAQTGGKCHLVATISAAADVTPQTVRNWRLGKSEPTVSAACAVARVLGVSLMDLTEPRA